MKKERIDVLLVEQGFFDSREKAKRNIMAGLVLVDQERIDKPGEKVDPTKTITVKGHVMPYVSRGGFKLEKAIRTFNIDLNGQIMVDVGASTGGFTDCALQHGAKFVYAIDVGYNQLDWKIRQHPQVKSIERCNFRYANKDLFTDGCPQFASVDVSFISLKLILPVLQDVLIDDGEIIALIKPQFEAGRELVGKHGIIKDKQVHMQVVKEIIDFSYQHSFNVLGVTFSPIKGTEGNIEFLLYLKKTNDVKPSQIDVKQIVDEAHELK
jgi:23S rRNA (cytidine1920-2'-O)/16S rRNA (cytidine1409-2'-O)-methyltransferase